MVRLTAVVTRLRFRPVERAEVRFQNGTVRPVLLADIALYVAERENPDNRKQVAAVEVELPALKELAPIGFVDTPGLGSALAHNTEATLQWLPNVGAALVAVSADAPLSERDEALIEELRRHTPRIVLLLTKADLLTDAQRAEVEEFVRRESRRRWQIEFPLFFYSIRPGWVKLRGELMQKLLLPLAQHHSEAATQITRHKLLSLADQALDYLRVGLAAALQATWPPWGRCWGERSPVSLACGRQRRKSRVCATHCRGAPASPVMFPSMACLKPFPHLWVSTPLFAGCRILL